MCEREESGRERRRRRGEGDEIERDGFSECSK
jgi:hypothetical protein